MTAAGPDGGRCVPCDDGRRLLLAAVVARLAWGLAAHRLAAAPETAFAPWAALAASSAAPVLAYRLAINLRLTRGAAWIAGAILAVHPALVEAGTRATPEAFVPLLAAAALVAGVYAFQSRRAAPAGLAALCAAGFLAAALAAAPGAPAALSKWSAALPVAPAVGPDARALLAAFTGVFALAALAGLGAVARGPGGGLALAWLAACGLLALRTGSFALPAAPVLAVLAGAGLSVLSPS